MSDDPMSEIDRISELDASRRDLYRVHAEYGTRYGANSTAPDFNFEELHEICGRILDAETRYATALEKVRNARMS